MIFGVLNVSLGNNYWIHHYTKNQIIDLMLLIKFFSIIIADTILSQCAIIGTRWITTDINRYLYHNLGA